MEFRKLQYFESVARLNNFTKAAEELHVAQPTITAAIKRMEEELGVALFVRDKRNVMLTCEGEIFLEDVKDILTRLDCAVAEIQEIAAGREWTVNIGIVPISGSRLMAILYKEFAEKYPQVRYKILEVGSYGVMEAINAGELDLGFLVLRDDMVSKYDICPVRRSELKILMNIENPLACQERISIEDLRDQKLIYFPKHSFVRQKMDVEFALHGIAPWILAQPIQMISVYNLVQQNAGVSFAIGDDYMALIKSEDIVAVPLKEPVYCDMGFIWKKGGNPNRAARKCLKFVLEHADEV